jgi:hypothetical protein
MSDMATKTEIKTAQIPDDVRQYVHDIINALRRALETGDFEIRIAYDNVDIKTPDVKAYVYKNLIRIMYKDIDIIYSNYVPLIKVYMDPYGETKDYYAHDYWAQLEEIHELAKEKIKSRLEKILDKL